MIEIERKFRLTEQQRDEIERTLKDNHGPIETVRQVDQVYLHGIDSFSDFKRGDPVVRLRTVNDESVLTYKRSINDSGDSVEHELTIGTPETMAAILMEMGYRLVTTVVKNRTIAKVGELAIMCDSVENAGHFLEIEIMAPDENSLPVAEQQILKTAEEFGLSADDIETRKYDQLVSASRA